MDRRRFNSATVMTFGLLAATAPGQSKALGLADLSNAEASQGLKAALEQGALAAVGLLGRPDGFLNNPQVRIPLPGFLASTSTISTGPRPRARPLLLARSA